MFSATFGSADNRDDEHGGHSTALAVEYGREGALQLESVFALLAAHGYPRAVDTDQVSTFERVLGGICWLLQRIVKREDAACGRVQWNLLFQAHEKMKMRLDLAQEVLSRVERLPFACPVPIQPHQLLLQDFGDIGTVKRLVQWLMDLDTEYGYGESVRAERSYLHLLKKHHDMYDTRLDLMVETGTPKREIVHLEQTFQPRRRLQFLDAGAMNEAEDALVQRCLLEYGERVCVHEPLPAQDEVSRDPDVQQANAHGEAVPKQRMAQLASEALASQLTKLEHRKNERGASNMHKSRMGKRLVGKKVNDFDAQFEQAQKIAREQEKILMEKHKERERQLLEQAVNVREPAPLDDQDACSSQQLDSSTQLSPEAALVQKEVNAVRKRLERYSTRLDSLKNEHLNLVNQGIETRKDQEQAQRHLSQLQFDLQQLEIKEASECKSQPQLQALVELVKKNEQLKHEKAQFKKKCREELELLKHRVEKLRQQAEEDAGKNNEEVQRFNEIELMHSQMAGKHKEMKVALSQQTRDVHKLSKRIDDVPSQIELIQYEKRFLELYDEVALTLDETRKYYCVYNTLKTTLGYLEKEISLINSIHDNFDTAMSSKAASEAFFTQIENIMKNVRSTISKQEAQRIEKQQQVDTLDSKYQLLLEKERMYVNAIREFQKECEKNEKMVMQKMTSAP